MKILQIVALIVLCAVAANGGEAKLVRVHPVTPEQYNELLKLTNGVSHVSESRMLRSSLGNLIPSLFINGNGPSSNNNNYPLCVVSADDKKRKGRETEFDVEEFLENLQENNNDNSNNNGGGNQKGRGDRNRPVVNCVVVVKDKDKHKDEDEDDKPPHRPSHHHYHHPPPPPPPPNNQYYPPRCPQCPYVAPTGYIWVIQPNNGCVLMRNLVRCSVPDQTDATGKTCTCTPDNTVCYFE